MKGQLTIVEMIYCQQYGRQPVCVDYRHSVEVEGTEDPYVNPRFKVGIEWKPIDLGWLSSDKTESKIGEILIENLDERNLLTTNPTKQQIEDMLSKVVEMAYFNRDGNEPEQRIKPGQSIRISPIDASRVRLRCSNGECRCRVVIFPA